MNKKQTKVNWDDITFEIQPAKTLTIEAWGTKERPTEETKTLQTKQKQ